MKESSASQRREKELYSVKTYLEASELAFRESADRTVASMTRAKRERRERTDNWELIQQWCCKPEQRL
jgi:ribosomal protein L20